MSLNETGNTEWQPHLWPYTQSTQAILDELELSEVQIQQQAPQLANLPTEELQGRVGIFSATTEIGDLAPSTIIKFLALNKTRLSQLATLVDKDNLPEETLIEISSSPLGINTEILLRHITHTIEQCPEDIFLLGGRDEQLLLSALKYSKEQNDINNQNRIKAVLSKVRKCSQKRISNSSNFSQPTLDLEIA